MCVYAYKNEKRNDFNKKKNKLSLVPIGISEKADGVANHYY